MTGWPEQYPPRPGRRFYVALFLWVPIGLALFGLAIALIRAMRGQ